MIQLEAANVGGQLVAEKLDIPSVLLAPHDMLNLVAEKTAPSTGFSDLFRRRKESFILAGRFMKMNKVRVCTCSFPSCLSADSILVLWNYSFVNSMDSHCSEIPRITLRQQQLR